MPIERENLYHDYTPIFFAEDLMRKYHQDTTPTSEFFNSRELKIANYQRERGNEWAVKAFKPKAALAMETWALSQAVEDSFLLAQRASSSNFIDSSKELLAIISRLSKLLKEDEFDEDGERNRPTSVAFNKAYNLICGVSSLLPNLPKPSIGVEPLGGLRFKWRHENRQLRLIIPGVSTGPSYIYMQQDDNPFLSWDVSKLSLSLYLNWLNGESPVASFTSKTTSSSQSYFAEERILRSLTDRR